LNGIANEKARRGITSGGLFHVGNGAGGYALRGGKSKIRQVVVA